MREAGSGNSSQKCGPGAVILDVDGFVRQFNPEARVGPISFEVKEGEFFSLLGPSGCGKTTTLRAIAGFELVDEGEISLRGKSISRTPPNKRGIGLVFQRPALFPHLKVRANVAFGLRQHRVAGDVAEQRVRSVIELVGLSGLENRLPSQLSGGQQQRVALARSLVLEPPLLLLDEPMSSLDLKLRGQMREELRKLQRRLNQTMVFVTHDQTEALAMSDRIAVLSNGRIEQIGTPREIYNRPATRFVASFIGESNQIDLTLQQEGQSDPFGVTPEGLMLTLGPDRQVSTKKATAIVRPEAIELMNVDAAPQSNSFGGIIIDEEFLGESTKYRVRLDCGLELTVSRKFAPSYVTRPSGSMCQVAIPPQAIYLLGE